MNRQTIYQLQDPVIMASDNIPKASKPEYGMTFWWDNEYHLYMEQKSNEFIGALLRMTRYYWHILKCKGAPNNRSELRTIIKPANDNEWKRLEPQIFDNDKFFKLSMDGKWHNKYIDKEWNKAFERCESASQHGKKAANARWNK